MTFNFKQWLPTFLAFPLGGYLAFAVLHTAFPILLNRRFPGEPVPVWTQLFPVLGLSVLAPNVALPLHDTGVHSVDNPNPFLTYACYPAVT